MGFVISRARTGTQLCGMTWAGCAEKFAEVVNSLEGIAGIDAGVVKYGATDDWRSTKVASFPSPGSPRQVGLEQADTY